MIAKRLAACAITASCILASPAAATWGGTRWGMSVDEVLATLGPTATRVEDEKDQRIQGAQRLVSAQSTSDSITYTVDYFFDGRRKTLTKVNLVPTTAECLSARAAFIVQLGEGKVESKSQQLMRDRPPLVSEERVWPDPAGEGTVSYSSVAFGDEMQYCQILFAA